MPRLILLNGPPACGKSTLARRYVEDHPLALNLDVDRVRSLLGRWRDEPHAAGLLAREIALAAARVHLAAGHDVVVPQYLGRMTFIEQLDGLARATGAAFHEVVLLDSAENTLRRFAERARAAAEPGPGGDWALVEHGGRFDDDLSATHDRLLAVLAARPGARVVQVQDGAVDRTYRAVLRALG